MADEPTTALDATMQAQILALIRQIQKKDGIAVILIPHDIGAVSVLADRVAVPYAGQVAEEGSAIDVLTAPLHPYTGGLLASVADFCSDNATGTKEIPGIAPNHAQLMTWGMPTCVTALAIVTVGVFTTVVPPAPAVAEPMLADAAVTVTVPEVVSVPEKVVLSVSV